jgi:3'-phosphoadenosine 5'-phosphosulfate sulfotransferase (PAPS reductase)/FAD synthetase
VKTIRVSAYALFSGGKDSMTLAHVLASQDMLEGVVAFDTGIAVPDWRPFIEDVCRQQGWDLTILSTHDSKFLKEPVTYEALVRRFGFPGPGMHGYFMTYLKGRCISQFRKLHPHALLASGVRAGESKRRLSNTRQWSVMEGMPVWAPLWDWTTEETWKYMHTHGLTRAPAYSTLGISGDCLCGAFASSGERETIAQVYPEVDARLCALEREVSGCWSVGKKRRGVSSTAERLICVECDPSGTPGSGTR